MVAPSKFAHVVYQTHRFEEMIDWYTRVFEARVQHRDERLAFLTYDDEHHRFAFVNMGPAPSDAALKRPNNAAGVNHLAYTWNGLDELVDTYKRLKSQGVKPWRPIRHGLTLSLYYQDPDSNGLEFQIDLMESQAANDFMKGAAFAKNPIGEPFDPDELAARVDAGKPVDDLIFRSDQAESKGGAIVNLKAPAIRAGELAPGGASAAEAFLARIAAIVPDIRKRAVDTERNGRVSDETMRALTDADVFRAVQPRKWGGLELDPATVFEGMVRIGAGCASTGWVASVVGVHAWHIGVFPEEGQREVWQDNPDVRASSSYAPTGKVQRVEGGFKLSGRWGFSSGVDFCDWAILGGVVPDDGTGAAFRSFLVPRRDFTVDDASWTVSGLQATGSKDLHVHDAFVPEHRTHSLVDVYHGTDPGRAVNTGPLFRLPWQSMFAYAIAAPAIAAAVGGLDAFVETTRNRISARGGAPVALNPALHMSLADALSVVGSERSRIGTTWNEMYALARDGQAIPLELRARCRYEAARAVGACIGAVLEVFNYAGGGVMNVGHPLQRYLRDLLAMRNHPFSLPEPRASAWAKAVLGVAPDPFNAATGLGVV